MANHEENIRINGRELQKIIKRNNKTQKGIIHLEDGGKLMSEAHFSNLLKKTDATIKKSLAIKIAQRTGAPLDDFVVNTREETSLIRFGFIHSALSAPLIRIIGDRAIHDCQMCSFGEISNNGDLIPRFFTARKTLDNIDPSIFKGITSRDSAYQVFEEKDLSRLLSYNELDLIAIPSMQLENHGEFRHIGSITQSSRTVCKALMFHPKSGDKPQIETIEQALDFAQSSNASGKLVIYCPSSGTAETYYRHYFNSPELVRHTEARALRNPNDTESVLRDITPSLERGEVFIIIGTLPQVYWTQRHLSQKRRDFSSQMHEMPYLFTKQNLLQLETSLDLYVRSSMSPDMVKSANLRDILYSIRSSCQELGGIVKEISPQYPISQPGNSGILPNKDIQNIATYLDLDYDYCFKLLSKLWGKFNMMTTLDFSYLEGGG